MQLLNLPRVLIHMKNPTSIKALALLACLSAASQATAADFSSYSDTELFQMQDQVRYMSSEDREAYRSERQARMQTLSRDERISVRSDNGQGRYRKSYGAGNGQGSMARSRPRDGSGGGQGKRYGQGGGRRR